MSQDVEAWVSQLSYSEHEALPNSMPREKHAFHATNFPSVQGSSWEPLGFWESHTRSDPDALWFFEEYPAVNESLKTRLWKVDVSVGTPRIVRYALPHPYDLMRRGIIKIEDEEGKSWVPSVSDYDTVKQLYLEEAEFDFASPHWDGQYDSLYSWGEDLIVTFGVHIWGGGNAHLLCKVEQDNLQPIKLTDAGFGEVYSLVKAQRITPYGGEISIATVGDLRWHYANAGFAEGYLYSVATAQWRDLQLRNDIVVVKNVHTGHVSWFCPEVPDSYVEGVTVPHWDPYWDRLKNG